MSWRAILLAYAILIGLAPLSFYIEIVWYRSADVTSGVPAVAPVVVLRMLRLRFWWWPFHPLGYIAANSWGGHWWYMPFFAGWALKSLTICYRGLPLYRQTVPVAIGLIVGDVTNTGLWAAVALATRGRL